MEFAFLSERIDRRNLYLQQFGDTDSSSVNTLNPDFLGHCNHLEDLLQNETRHWLDATMLRQYLSKKMILRGLRIFKTSCFSQDITFMKCWNEILDNCSFALMKLLITHREDKVKCLSEEIEQTKSLISQFKGELNYQDRLENMNDKLKKFEMELTRNKQDKIYRDQNDYASDKVRSYNRKVSQSLNSDMRPYKGPFHQAPSFSRGQTKENQRELGAINKKLNGNTFPKPVISQNEKTRNNKETISTKNSYASVVASSLPSSLSNLPLDPSPSPSPFQQGTFRDLNPPPVVTQNRFQPFHLESPKRGRDDELEGTEEDPRKKKYQKSYNHPH